MTGLDTNVLVRYLVQDDETQLRAVLNLLLKKKATFFVPDLVLVEADWVLTSLYHWTVEEVADAFARLLTIQNLLFEDEGRLRSALRAVRQGADLSDELIVDAQKKYQSVLEWAPGSSGSRDFRRLAQAVVDLPPIENASGRIQFFMNRMLHAQ
jgi:predicted nucleic-acid-binding protein